MGDTLTTRRYDLASGLWLRRSGEGKPFVGAKGNTGVGSHGDHGHFVTIEGHAVFIPDGAGHVPARVKAEGSSRFTRAHVERALVEHHEKTGGTWGPEHDAELESTNAGGDHFTFKGKLPTEIKEHMAGRPELRKLFKVTDSHGGGADAFSALGDRYLELAEMKAGSPIRAALKTAKESNDPEMQFLAKVHESLPKDEAGQKAAAARARKKAETESNPEKKAALLKKAAIHERDAAEAVKMEKLNPTGLRVGDRFHIGGVPHRVVEDEHGFRVLKHGKDYSHPLDALQHVPHDKGTFRPGKAAKKKQYSDGIPFSRRYDAATGEWYVNGVALSRNLFDKGGGGGASGRQGHLAEGGYWRTINGHHVFFKGTPGSGTPTKGNPHVIAHVSGHVAVHPDRPYIPPLKPRQQPGEVKPDAPQAHVDPGEVRAHSAREHEQRVLAEQAREKAAAEAAKPAEKPQTNADKEIASDKARRQRARERRHEKEAAEREAIDKQNAENTAKIATRHGSLANASLTDFAAKVQELADNHPVGFGDNKVFIHHVFEEAQKLDPSLDRKAFKEKLVMAHRAGLITTSRADMVAAMHPEDVKHSNTALMGGDPEDTGYDAGNTFKPTVNFILAKPAQRQPTRGYMADTAAASAAFQSPADFEKAEAARKAMVAADEARRGGLKTGETPRDAAKRIAAEHKAANPGASSMEAWVAGNKQVARSMQGTPHVGAWSEHVKHATSAELQNLAIGGSGFGIPAEHKPAAMQAARAERIARLAGTSKEPAGTHRVRPLAPHEASAGRTHEVVGPDGKRVGTFPDAASASAAASKRASTSVTRETADPKDLRSILRSEGHAPARDVQAGPWQGGKSTGFEVLEAHDGNGFVVQHAAGDPTEVAGKLGQYERALTKAGYEVTRRPGTSGLLVRGSADKPGERKRSLPGFKTKAPPAPITRPSGNYYGSGRDIDPALGFSRAYDLATGQWVRKAAALPDVLSFSVSSAAGKEWPALGEDRPKDIDGRTVKYFWKRILMPGTVYHPDERIGPIVLSRDIIAQSHKSTREWMKTEGGKPFVPTRHKGYDATSNLGWIVDTKLDNDGSLWGLHQLIGEDAHLAAARNETSVQLRPKFRSGKSGKVYPWLLEHNAIVPDPVQEGLGRFEPVSFSRSHVAPTRKWDTRRGEWIRLSRMEEEGHWVTINGARVFIDGDGKVSKGPSHMVGKHAADLSDKVSHKDVGHDEAEVEKHADRIRRHNYGMDAGEAKRRAEGELVVSKQAAASKVNAAIGREKERRQQASDKGTAKKIEAEAGEKGGVKAYDEGGAKRYPVLLTRVGADDASQNLHRKLTVYKNGVIEIEAGEGWTEAKLRHEGWFHRQLEEQLSGLPDDVYVRVTHNKEDHAYLSKGEHRGSKNHRDNKEEGGLSVSKSPEIPAKYGYLVKGEEIGGGTDGEPLLDHKSARPITKLMSHVKLSDKLKEFRRKRLAELGWTEEQARHAFSSPHLIRDREEFRSKSLNGA